MNGDYAVVLAEEIEDWNRIIFRVAMFPVDVFRLHGTSGFCISLHEMASEPDESANKRNEVSFQSLCDSVPNIQRQCVDLISKSYGALMILNLHKNNINNKVAIRGLISSAEAKGAVLSMLPESPMLKAYQAMQREKQIATHKSHGSNGGKARHRGTHELRDWVIANTDQRLPKNMNTAKKLVEKLPAHLIDKSNNSERFIYDVLRAQIKKSI